MEFKGDVEVTVRVKGEVEAVEKFEKVHWDIGRATNIVVYDKSEKSEKEGFLELMDSWLKSDNKQGVKSELTFKSVNNSSHLPILGYEKVVFIEDVNLIERHCFLLTPTQIEQNEFFDRGIKF